MKNKLTVFVVIFVTGIQLIGPLDSYEIQDHSDPLESIGQLLLCQDPPVDVFVGRVFRSQDRSASYGNPPKLKVFVEEVLRGSLKPKSLVSCLWLPDGRAESNMLFSKEAWSSTPMNAPNRGSRFILFFTGEEQSELQIGPLGRFQLTSERLGRIKNVIETPKNDLCH